MDEAGVNDVGATLCVGDDPLVFAYDRKIARALTTDRTVEQTTTPTVSDLKSIAWNELTEIAVGRRGLRDRRTEDRSVNYSDADRP